MVTSDNINNAFPYVPPPPSSNPQLKTPQPTPEAFDLSTPSGCSQGSTGVAPPSSRPPYTPTPSRWPLEPANRVAPCNPQGIHLSSMFMPFSTSQPTAGSVMPYGQPPWSPFHSGPYGMIQQPTLEDFRRAYEVMMIMWFQRPPMPQQPPLQPPPTQASPSPYPPPILAPQNPQSGISAHPDASRARANPVSLDLSRQGSTNFNNVPRNPGDLQGGLFPGTPNLPTSSPVQIDLIPRPPQSGDTATVPPLLRTRPELFEHDVGKPIMFFVPSTLRKRGKIAEIFRVSSDLYLLAGDLKIIRFLGHRGSIYGRCGRGRLRHPWSWGRTAL